MDESPALPTDVMGEILSRTCLETLEQSRLVSKGLKQITHDPTFIQLFRERTKSQLGFFVQGLLLDDCEYVSTAKNANLDPKLSLNVLTQSPIRILASTNSGILFCINLVCDTYYVCKPTTKQWQAIPNPSTRFDYLVRYSMVLLQRSRPLRYKIVMLKLLGKVRCEIFDSETWAWKELTGLVQTLSISPNYNPNVYMELFKSKIWVCGTFYWRLSQKAIVELDLESQSLEIFELPYQLYNGAKFRSCLTKLVEYDGRPAIICFEEYEGCCIQLWVMDKTGQKTKWTLKNTFRNESLAEILRRNRSHIHVFSCRNDNTALLLQHEYSVIVCKLEDCSFNEFKLNFKPQIYTQIFRFHSDCEPIDLRPNPISRTTTIPKPISRAMRPNPISRTTTIPKPISHTMRPNPISRTTTIPEPISHTMIFCRGLDFCFLRIILLSFLLLSYINYAC